MKGLLPVNCFENWYLFSILHVRSHWFKRRPQKKTFRLPIQLSYYSDTLIELHTLAQGSVSVRLCILWPNLAFGQKPWTVL